MKQRPEFALARKLAGPSQLERVRAARAILDGQRSSEALALEAFLAIFHPEMKNARRRELVGDVRQRTRSG